MALKYLLGIWMAAVSLLGFLCSMVYGVRYLLRRNIIDDFAAAVWAEIGLLFIVVATVSGAIFAKATWGAYWSWDPRQTSIFVLFLIYMAYLALRSAVDDPERRAALSSVYSVIAFVTVPLLVFVIPRLPGIQGLHPDDAIISKDLNMDTRMLLVFIASLIGFTGVSYWMFRLKMRQISLKLADAEQSRRK
jgi:heme exporter protein C